MPPGPAADLVREARAGEIVPPDNPNVVSDKIINAYSRWMAGELVIYPNMHVIQRYDRRLLTGRLAAVLDTISSTVEVGHA